MREKTEEADFIIVDDDPLGTLITRRIINLCLPKATVTSFTGWKPAIDYFASIAGQPHTKTYTVFLEIHMEFNSGWEFLEAFQKLDASVQSRVRISILSTILSDKDLLCANKYALIHTFIEKPLSVARLSEVLLPETTFTRK